MRFDMRDGFARRFTKGISRLALAILLAVPALAEGEKLPPYDVAGFPNDRVWIPWVFVFLFVVLIAAVSFKNPRRSHLD